MQQTLSFLRTVSLPVSLYVWQRLCSRLFWTLCLSVPVQVTEQFICRYLYRWLNNTVHLSVQMTGKYTLYLCTGHRTFYLSVPVQVTEQYIFCEVTEHWTIYLSVQKTEQFICQFRWLNNISVCTDDWTIYLSVVVTEQCFYLIMTEQYFYLIRWLNMRCRTAWDPFLSWTP
jgi:hypothetical protein